MLQGLNIDGSAGLWGESVVRRGGRVAQAAPRICVLLGSHWSSVMGGAQYQAKCLLDALAQQQRGDLYYVTRDADPDFRPEGYTLVRASTVSGMQRGVRRTVHDLRTFDRILRAIDPQVIYQRGGGVFTGIAARYAVSSGCRMVWNIAHDEEVTPQPLRLSRDIAYRVVERRLLEYGIRHATSIVAQHSDQVSLLKTHYGRDADAIVRNFHPSPTEPIEKRRPCTVVWVANLKRFKQPHLFLELAAALRDKTDARFVMVGGMQARGAARAELTAAIERSDNVRYTGALPQEEVNRLLAGADLLVNTSTAEGFSNTFVQAWSRQVPVVSLNVNPERILDARQVGIHSGNFPQLVKDVLDLLSDHERRTSMGLCARDYANSHHSERNIESLMPFLLPGAGQG